MDRSTRSSKKLTESIELKPSLSLFDPISILGKGSFGVVYLVRHKNSGKLFALKVILKELILTQNIVRYIYTEKNVQSKFKHPFMVKLYCAFQSKTRLFMVMDYCPGGDLGKLLQNEIRFTEDRARIYLCEILLALEDLHKREIIYRDLKPDNVVLDEEGHALLTDFGLSKQRMKDNEYTMSFCGSVAYLAPEMLKKSGHGRSVDWYLLGVLLYEMLVGIPPYFHKDKTKLFYNIQKGPLEIPSDMSPDALDLIVSLLDRDPVNRLGAGPSDAEEIKGHQFFKSVDWNKVLKRKLNPPKPCIVPIKETGITFDKIMDKESDDDNSMTKWTFISNDFK